MGENFVCAYSHTVFSLVKSFSFFNCNLSVSQLGMSNISVQYCYQLVTYLSMSYVYNIENLLVLTYWIFNCGCLFLSLSLSVYIFKYICCQIMPT